MQEVQYLTINDEQAAQRLDNFLFRHLKGVPKSHVYRMIRGGEVRVNKKRAQAGQKLMTGDVLRIPPVRVAQPLAPAMLGARQHALLTASVVAENDDFIVINKPAGWAVHGGSGIHLGVIEALRQWRPQERALELVHRLDRDTSGCLMVAKKRSALKALQALLVEKTLQKKYWAILAGHWSGKSKVWVDKPLKKNILQSGERMVFIDETGKPSQSTVCLRENYREACWVEVEPKTGRTHQIRVHCASLGHPVLGDSKYGTADLRSRKIFSRLYLHAHAIQFTLKGQHFYFEAPPDAHFQQALTQLRAEGED